MVSVMAQVYQGSPQMTSPVAARHISLGFALQMCNAENSDIHMYDALSPTGSVTDTFQVQLEVSDVLLTSGHPFCRSGFKRRREATVCRSLLQKLKDEQSNAVRNQQYPAASCPICFEDLAKPEPSSSSPSSSSAACVADVYKDSQSDCNHGASSSKCDAPSAPPLDAHPEYQTLLDKSKTHGSAEQDEHKHRRSRCVQLVSPVFAYACTLPPVIRPYQDMQVAFYIVNLAFCLSFLDARHLRILLAS